MGPITIKRNEIFKPIWDWQGKYVVLKGGKGSGKSRALAQYIVYRMIRDTPLRILVMMKHQVNIRGAAYQELKSVIEGMGIADSFDFTVSPMEIKFKSNGNNIMFRGLDDSQKLKSISEVNMIWLEEADMFEFEDFMEAEDRLRGLKKHGHKILISFNPTSDQSWLKSRFFDIDDPEALVINSTYLDNEYLEPNHVDRYKHFTEAVKRVALYGEWGRTSVEGMFYQKFDSTIHTTNDLPYNPELPLIYSMDFNSKPFSAALVAQMPDANTLHIIDEIARPGLNIAAVCKVFVREYEDHEAGMMFTGDPSGKAANAAFEDGFNYFKIIENELWAYRPINKVPSSAPTHVARGNFINDIFEIEAGGLKILISKKCKALIKDLEYQPVTPDGKKDKTKEKGVEKYGHASDAFDYIVATVWANQLREHGKPKKTVEFYFGNNQRLSKYSLG